MSSDYDVNRFSRTFDTQYWVPVPSGGGSSSSNEPKMEKLWAMQACAWDETDNKLHQVWHIVDKRVIGSDTKGDTKKGDTNVAKGDTKVDKGDTKINKGDTKDGDTKEGSSCLECVAGLIKW